METANLPNFLKFGNANKSDICDLCEKKSWVATKLGGLGKTRGLLRPGPKTATIGIV